MLRSRNHRRVRPQLTSMKSFFLFCLGAIVFALTASPCQAQILTYGKNKVQYTRFEWQVLEGDLVDLYYYTEELELAKIALDTARSLGASGFQSAIVVLREVRFAVMAAVIMGFGRAISEVGISLMVGMNIKDFTRTITTAISLETSKGDLELSIALGIILIFIALVSLVLC